MAVVTTSLVFKRWTCDLRFRSANLVSPNRNRRRDPQRGSAGSPAEHLGWGAGKNPLSLSANVLRHHVVLSTLALARSLQKNHLHFWFRSLDQILNLFNCLDNVAGNQIIPQIHMRVDQKANWEDLLKENHFHVVYDEPAKIIGNGEILEIPEMLLRLQELVFNGQDVANNTEFRSVGFRAEVYSWDKTNLRGFGECNEFFIEAFCNTEIKKHLSGEGFRKRCDQLGKKTANGI